MAWEPEHDLELRKSVERGLSFAEARDRLNSACSTTYTRNACIGRAKRQGFKSPNAPCVSNRAARKWSGKMDEVLAKVLTSQGGTYADAASEVSRLGLMVSRDACIKRSRRIGCHSVVTERTADILKQKSPTLRLVPAPIKLRCVEVDPRRLAVIELELGDCRYPYGGDIKGDPITFCGCQAIEGKSYCAPHYALTRSTDQVRGGGRAAAELRARLYKRNVA